MKPFGRNLAAVVVLAVSALASASGCSSGSGAANTGDDQNATQACKVFSVRDGRNLKPDELAKLNDPISRRILQNGCAQQVDGMITALTSAKDCQGSQISTRLVSERSLLLGKPDSYRGILSQNCSGGAGGSSSSSGGSGDAGTPSAPGTDHDVFVSLFGIDPNDSQLPQDGTEVIGHDATNGVFNFYVNEGGWKFMGSSKDAVIDGYDCTDRGDCLPKSASKARCWGCHESGGINMKELHSPWHAWEPTDIKADAPFQKFGKQLGNRENGINMETRTENANVDWNSKRIEILKGLGAADLLRPLFCTLTINLQASGSAGNVSFIPGEFFVPAPNGGEVFFQGVGFSAGGLSIDNTAYQAAIAKNGQKIVDGRGQQLTGADGKPVVESPSGFIFPKKGDIDNRYIAALVNANIIDRDFVLDVLHVDFTRPIFSPDRCGLVDSAPNLKGADLTPDKIREGFKSNLAKASSPAAAQLLKSLGDTNDAAAHGNDVNAFFTACGARPKPDMLADLLQYNAHLKFAAKAHRTKSPDGPVGIIEFSETFPVDNLQDTSKFFDPVTCVLK